MIQQHCMIYSGFNIVRQDCFLGLGCFSPVCCHHVFCTNCSFSFSIYKRQGQSALSSETGYLNKSKHSLNTCAFIQLSIEGCFSFPSLTLIDMICIQWMEEFSNNSISTILFLKTNTILLVKITLVFHPFFCLFCLFCFYKICKVNKIKIPVESNEFVRIGSEAAGCSAQVTVNSVRFSLKMRTK